MFRDCSVLTSVTIGNSVTSIGFYAFYNCSSLASITIPNSVKSIDDGAFQDCSSLTFIIICSGVNNISSTAFTRCSQLTDVYCFGENVPSNTSTGAFYDTHIENVTLHVPASALEDYQNTEPWSNFGTIVALTDGDYPVTPETPKCATPEINYKDGKLDFTCETEGVEFISEVTVEDAKKYYDTSVTLSQTYKVSVYATKAGYDNSDVVTREIVIENGQSSLFGDLNKDGKVNVADHVKLSEIIMDQNKLGWTVESAI